MPPLAHDHKFHQHDADLDSTVHDDDPELVDPDEAWASAVTPEEYVLSSPEAMASAIDQARLL